MFINRVRRWKLLCKESPLYMASFMDSVANAAHDRLMDAVE